MGKGTWGGVILTIWTFFKAKNSHSVNTEHQLKSKLISTKCPKSENRTKMDQAQWLQLKMSILIGYNLKIVIS